MRNFLSALIHWQRVLPVCCCLAGSLALAQPGGGGQVASPRAGAPIDLEGYWVSVVNEDWMFRMVTPPPGEYLGVPLNRAGRELADSWDPEADARNGQQCKAYGAPALLRMPGRIRFSWQDEDSLLLEAEAGEQSRLFEFAGTVENGQPSRQGQSLASWELAGGTGSDRYGNLRVETSGLLPGYLRKNGVPYSENARLTEFYAVYAAPNGDTWLVVTTEVEDPRFLNQSFITSSHFKKLDDRDGERQWRPQACTSN